MGIRVLVFILLGVMLPLLSQGQVKSFELKTGKMAVDLATGWDGVPGLFDIPLVFVGPTKNGSHPTLSVIPTSVSAQAMDPAEMKFQEASFKQGRERWLEKNGGHALEYVPHREVKLSKGSAHILGYRYALGSDEFAEFTYFASCNGKYYQLQSLMTLSEEREQATSIEKMVRSLVCE